MEACDSRQAGFTLIELMIVVIIVAILASIAVPGYQDQVRKARRADAHEALLTLQTLQEKWRASHSSYSDTLVALGISDGQSRQGYYTLAVESANANGYILTAKATGKGGQHRDAGCVDMVLEVGPDKPRGERTPSACW
ncbi:MAG TPA: type IV pilin protein [Porticoccaceae bacterium]